MRGRKLTKYAKGEFPKAGKSLFGQNFVKELVSQVEADAVICKASALENKRREKFRPLTSETDVFFEGARAAGMVRAPARTCSIHTPTGLPSREGEGSRKTPATEAGSPTWDPVHVETAQTVLQRAKTGNANLFCTNRKHKNSDGSHFHRRSSSQLGLASSAMLPT